MVEYQSTDNKSSGEEKTRLEHKAENEHWKHRCHDHGRRYYEKTKNAAGVFHHKAYENATDCLRHNQDPRVNRKSPKHIKAAFKKGNCINRLQHSRAQLLGLGWRTKGAAYTPCEHSLTPALRGCTTPRRGDGLLIHALAKYALPSRGLFHWSFNRLLHNTHLLVIPLF